MKKLLAVIAVALLVAAIIWVVLRVQLAHRLAAVPELLPETTLVLVEAPDFRRTRAEWQKSDLCQIWHEPAVQAWLHEPLAHLSKNHGGRRILEDFLRLGPTHGFVALTSFENNEPKLIGGFHFDRSEAEARTFVEERKAQWLRNSGEAKRATTVYEQHQIETLSVAHLVFASVYDNGWFFVANDLATLKALLDRVDHRGKKAPALQENGAFSDAVRHLPNGYATLLFFDPRPFLEKLIPIVALTGQTLPLDQMERLKRIRTVAAAFGFDRGKMAETDFVAMPQAGAEEKLERRSLAAAGTNTFFYSVSRLRWPANTLSPVFPASPSLPAVLQQLTAALQARGIARNDLQEAFGEELEIVGDWPAGSSWPVFQATLPVKDPVRARKIAEAMTSVELSGAPWTQSEKDGTIIYSAQPFGGFVPLRLALAVSDRTIFAGSDAAAIEAALTRAAAPTRELENSAVFQDAAKQVPPGKTAFNYIDTRLLFERADSAVRPFLLMGATFFPALGRNLDPSKLPSPEVIAKHLSPIVMSQRYQGDGYVTESIGPVTFRQAMIGLAGTIGGLFVYLQDAVRSVRPIASPSVLFPPATPSPSPSASPF